MTILDGDGIYGLTTSDPLKAPKGIAAVVPTSGTVTTNPASGVIGNYQEAIGSYTALTSGQYADGGNAGLLLDPGIYDLQAIIQYSPNGATTTTLVFGFIGTASGNANTGLDLLRNAFKTALASQVIGDMQTTTPVYRVVVTTQTRYYPKVFTQFATNVASAANHLFARRVA